jgi:hypothetical protein
MQIPGEFVMPGIGRSILYWNLKNQSLQVTTDWVNNNAIPLPLYVRKQIAEAAQQPFAHAGVALELAGRFFHLLPSRQPWHKFQKEFYQLLTEEVSKRQIENQYGPLPASPAQGLSASASNDSDIDPVGGSPGIQEPPSRLLRESPMVGDPPGPEARPAAVPEDIKQRPKPP